MGDNFRVKIQMFAFAAPGTRATVWNYQP
ncbi:protein of unknown function [Rhodovastum atsumiense]|nr:protein of unknown function [Rhodovastum atsumiense]